jgi:electron transport complex protein RnfC
MSSLELLTIPPPSHLYIPLSDVKGHPLTSLVKVGNTVLPDQALAYHEDTVVHAAYGGVVQSLSLHPMIFHKPFSVMTLVIKTEPSLQAVPPLKHRNFHDMVLNSGVIGMGGAGFSTARKCVPKIHSILINAMECEPVIKADECLMHNYPENIIAGIKLLQDQYPEAVCYFCMEESKSIDMVSTLPHFVQVKVLPAHYPSGAERTLIRSVLQHELPVGVPASDQGILCINISTVAAMADAAVGKPLTHRIITVADNIHHRSVNIMAAVGTRVIDILTSLNTDVPTFKCSQGGQYMPTRIYDLNAPVMKTTNCILIEPDIQQDIMPCIRCSACVPVCPEQLLPQQLYWHLKADDLEHAKSLNLEACIACGACDAVCPSHIPLAPLFAYGKERIYLEKQEQGARVLSEERYTARESRKARLLELREQKREIKRESLTLDDRKRAIQAALERVKEKQPP